MAIAIGAGRGELLVAACAYRYAGWRHGDRHQRLRKRRARPHRNGNANERNRELRDTARAGTQRTHNHREPTSEVKSEARGSWGRGRAATNLPSAYKHPLCRAWRELSADFRLVASGQLNHLKFCETRTSAPISSTRDVDAFIPTFPF